MNSLNVSLFALMVIACASAIPHSLLTEADVTGCQKACPDIYLPVCGYKNNEYKLFDNDCNMEVVNCVQKFRHSGVFSETSMNLCDQKVTVKEENIDCNKPCTMEYNPVCALNGRKAITYGNLCMFEIANCESNYNLRVTKIDECLDEKENLIANEIKNDCNHICTFEYNPICGFDGQKVKTYANICTFETANCESNYKLRITRIEECQEVDNIQSVKEIRTECIRPCPASYIPVCGFDGENYHTYGNTCEFEMINCDSENHLRMVRNGECSKDLL